MIAEPDGGVGKAVHGPGGKQMAPLVIGAIGVVFGDIGTSPLYTLHQCFSGQTAAQTASSLRRFSPTALRNSSVDR